MTARPSTMRAWQKHFGTDKPQRVEVPVPSAPANGLLVKIHAAGVCHSDVALLAQPKPAVYMNEKYTLGHEGCGEVVEVGPQVDPTHFQVGDMVSVSAVAGCNSASCGECTRGFEQICQTGEHYGIGNDGAYADYIAVKPFAAANLPQNVPPEVGAVATDAVMTAYHAVVGTGNVKKGETVVIVGIGGLGFNAMQIALSLGANVIVTDKRQEVLDEAVKFGAPARNVVPPDTALTDFVSANNLVVDTVIDFVGVPETFTASQHAVRMGGKLVQVGLLAPQIEVDNFLATRKHLQVLFSYGGTMHDLRACLDLIARGVVKPQVVKGHMDDFPRVLDDLHHGKIKSRIALVP